MRQDLDKGSGEKEKFILGDATVEIAGSIAFGVLEQTLDSGRRIEIPSLGKVITPDRELQDLTEED